MNKSITGKDSINKIIAFYIKSHTKKSGNIFSPESSKTTSQVDSDISYEDKKEVFVSIYEIVNGRVHYLSRFFIISLHVRVKKSTGIISPCSSKTKILQVYSPQAGYLLPFILVVLDSLRALSSPDS